MPLTTDNLADHLGRWTPEQLAEARGAIGPWPWLGPDALLWLIGTGICADDAEAMSAIEAGQLCLRDATGRPAKAVSDGVRIAASDTGGLIMRLRSRWLEPPLIDRDGVVNGMAPQLRPHTLICAAVRDVQIYEGQWLNCDFPASWRITLKHRRQQTLCTWQFPKLVNHGLEPCKVDCRHRRMVERDLDADEVRRLMASGAITRAQVETALRVDGDDLGITRLVRLTVPEYLSRSVE